MPASIFAQGASVVRIDDRGLMPDSPRNYNCSIAEHRGDTWLAYRSHRMDQGGRCGIAIAALKGGLAARSQWLELPRPAGGEHHEDPRLFVFAGALHLAYVESRFHPGRPYTCRIRYARLARKPRAGWVAEQIFTPAHGRNDGLHQEKNWMFFEARPGVLHAIYQGEPHTVLEFAADGETVARVHQAPAGAVRWPWGEIRGGTPPVRLPDGRWLTIFHSSRLLPALNPPHWRRYYAAAYTFEPEPPLPHHRHQPAPPPHRQRGRRPRRRPPPRR